MTKIQMVGCMAMAVGIVQRRDAITFGGQTMTDQELLAALASEPCLKAAVERIMEEREEARRMARLYRRFIKDVSTLQKAIRHVWKGPFFKEGEEDVEKEWLNADWLRQEE